MPSQRQAVYAENAPKPNGNYSHVIRQGNILHVAGFMGDTLSGEIIEGGIEAQAVSQYPRNLLSDGYKVCMADESTQKQAILNIKACLEAADSSLDKVVRRRIYIIDMKQFRQVDQIWAEYLEEPFPVSTCVGVTALAKEGALVEIEVVAEA